MPFTGLMLTARAAGWSLSFPDMHRRKFLVRAGTAAALGTLATAPATATQPGQPDSVTIDYPQSRLERYRPRLVLRDVNIQLDALYAWRSASPDYDNVEYLSYWAWYPAQEGGSSSDSHVPDREPVIVVVDEDTDAIQRVFYDELHYLVGRDPAPATDGGHPLLDVVDPWHPYQPTAESGTLVKVRDLRDRYQAWLDAGWPVDRQSVTDPPTVLARGHWWEDTAAGVSIRAFQARLGQRLGFVPFRET